MNKPIRTTIVFALVSGFLVLPLIQLLSGYWYWPTASKLLLWADLAIYAVLLARWSRTRLLPILFPLGLLLGVALWPDTQIGFYALALGVLCWVRSGICFKSKPMRTLMAELITLAGGITLVGILGSNSMAAWPLGLCLFILVQSLYFFIISEDGTQKNHKTLTDPFEQACREAEKVMEGLQ